MGVVEEEKIDNMTYIFFQDVLAALGKKINYESISNMYGRTVFDKKGGESINKAIAEANPLTKQSTKNSALSFLNMPGKLKIMQPKEESWFDTL